MIIHPAKKRTPDKDEKKDNRITANEVLAVLGKHPLLLLVGVAAIASLVYVLFVNR